MSSIQDENYESSRLAISQNDLNGVSKSERFESANTPTGSPSKLQPPDVAGSEVTHYAYDPETYQILCRPDQRLSQKKAQRLQDLNLYAHVVTMAKA
jgi:hypothetical protein